MKFIHPKNKDIIGLHFEYEQKDGVDTKTRLYLWNISRRELLDGVGYPVSASRFVGDIPNREIARQVTVRRMLKNFHADGQHEMAKRVGRAYFDRSTKPTKKRLPQSKLFKSFLFKQQLVGLRELMIPSFFEFDEEDETQPLLVGKEA